MHVAVKTIDRFTGLNHKTLKENQKKKNILATIGTLLEKVV